MYGEVCISAFRPGHREEPKKKIQREPTIFFSPHVFFFLSVGLADSPSGPVIIPSKKSSYGLHTTTVRCNHSFGTANLHHHTTLSALLSLATRLREVREAAVSAFPRESVRKRQAQGRTSLPISVNGLKHLASPGLG